MSLNYQIGPMKVDSLIPVSFQYTNLCGREAVIISTHGGVTALVTTLSVYSRARGRWTCTKLYTIMKGGAAAELRAGGNSSQGICAPVQYFSEKHKTGAVPERGLGEH